ncbi:hypothetical protein GF336_04895 [Candidatus Woesearchaeota archaeon]|nr:hypothetical protein [Candidatus Woesearchaeota archaeon]
MPPVLETGLLNYFSSVFPALLVFVLVFAILEKTKFLGQENKSINALVAIFLAFIAMMSQDIITIINFIAPWFVLVFIFALLLVFIYRFMGASEGDLTDFIKTDKPVQWFIFAIGMIIVIAGISHVYGQRLLPVTTGDDVTEETPSVITSAEGENVTTSTTSYSRNVASVFFHPKVIGLIFVFLVAVFAISLLTASPGN